MEQHAILQPTTAHLHLQKVRKSRSRKIEKSKRGFQEMSLILCRYIISTSALKSISHVVCALSMQLSALDGEILVM
jgi:hypothetical protein